MFNALRRFLADDDGYLVAQDWAILATVLLLGSVLALAAARNALDNTSPTEERPAVILRQSPTR